jgi:hypothetical protein
MSCFKIEMVYSVDWIELTGIESKSKLAELKINVFVSKVKAG